MKRAQNGNWKSVGYFFVCKFVNLNFEIKDKPPKIKIEGIIYCKDSNYV